MGLFHQQVVDHICKLIKSPEIISPTADPRSATLSGFSSWKRPDVMQATQAMNAEDKRPYLKEMFIAFLDFLHTRKRFAAEFAADDEIAKLTDTHF